MVAICSVPKPMVEGTKGFGAFVGRNEKAGSEFWVYSYTVGDVITQLSRTLFYHIVRAYYVVAFVEFVEHMGVFGWPAVFIDAIEYADDKLDCL